MKSAGRRTGRLDNQPRHIHDQHAGGNADEASDAQGILLGIGNHELAHRVDDLEDCARSDREKERRPDIGVGKTSDPGAGNCRYAGY